MRHLLYIAAGVFPGFSPISHDELLPTSLLQKAYLEEYNLKKYYPTVMAPQYFDMNALEQSPVYYSLQFPTTFDFSANPSLKNSTIFELSELKYLMEKYLKEIANTRLRLESTAIYKITEKVDFNFFSLLA